MFEAPLSNDPCVFFLTQRVDQDVINEHHQHIYIRLEDLIYEVHVHYQNICQPKTHN